MVPLKSRPVEITQVYLPATSNGYASPVDSASGPPACDLAYYQVRRRVLNEGLGALPGLPHNPAGENLRPRFPTSLPMHPETQARNDMNPS